MEENSNPSREPNEIELFIIKTYVKNIRSLHIGSFVVFGILDLALWYFTIIVFSENWILGFFMLILALLLTLLAWSIRETIKETGKTRSYEIVSTKGQWSLEIRGSGKTRQLKSIVNNEIVTMIVPGLATPPKHGEKRDIQYEYVKILDHSPTFGAHKLFVSIDDNVLICRHKEYVEKAKVIGIPSILSIPIFFCFTLFNLVSGFEFQWAIWLWLGLIFPCMRTIFHWIENKELRLKLESSAKNE